MRLLVNVIDWHVRNVHAYCENKIRYLRGLNMTFPNYLIALHCVWDLYACFAVASIGLLGAFLCGMGVALKLTNRR